MFGGCFDDEFTDGSRRFFEGVERGDFVVMLGETTRAELAEAPERVQLVALALADKSVLEVSLNDEVAALRDACLATNVVSRKWQDDATHVALASVHRADVLVSWNFKHIVNFQRIKGVHAVNQRLGYPLPNIHTPLEVLIDEAQDEDI